jgi:hypothetical protein
MKALIDGDNLAVACAFSAAGDTAEIACARARGMIEVILTDTGADEYEIWLSGKDNFRYAIYPEYKAKRIDVPRAEFEQDVKAHLTSEWQANMSQGCEADDMLGVRLMELGKDAILCHLDKDMNMIPGKHYNWELRRLGKVIREAKIYDVTEQDAIRFFYYQMLVGDATDNIKGIPGTGPKKASTILEGIDYAYHEDNDPLSLEARYFRTVRDLYSSDEEMEMNGKVLWIWRKMNDIWVMPKEEEMV